MASKKEATDLAKWRVELMRLTAFTAEDFGANVDAWWQSVANAPPESKTEKVRESTRVLEGHLSKSKLVLSAVANRVDWILGFDPMLDQEYEGTPNIGSYEQVLEAFTASISPWIKSCPPVLRLAWGAALIIPVKDRVEGYKELKNLLPTVDIDTQNSSDFLYQINRPRRSKSVPAMTINRLQKWSVLQILNISIPLGAPNSKSPVAMPTSVPGRMSCRVELDINSAPDRTEPIPAKKITALYSELLDLGKEIAMRGDQK